MKYVGFKEIYCHDMFVPYVQYFMKYLPIVVDVVRL